MRGHIRKRGDSWAIVLDVGRNPATGRRQQKWHSGYRTQREAQRALPELLSKLNKGTYVSTNRLTVAEYLREWLAGARVDLRDSTLPGYEIAVEKHLVPGVGHYRLQDLRPHHLTAFYAELLRSGHRQREGGLSPRTVSFVHSVLRRALQDAVESRLLDANPADAKAVRPPAAKTAKEAARKKRRTWTVEELGRFLDSLGDNSLRAAFHLAAMTGMRRGEVLGLRWRDLDLDAGRLRVVQTLVAPRYVLTVSEPKTDHGRRSIDLDEGTVAVLRAHRKRQTQDQLALGAGYQPSELVFRNADGSPVVPHLFSLAFKRAVKRAGLPPCRLHDLRHTHATLLAMSGEHPKVVQERLGHHSPGFTLETYTDAFPSQQREAARRFAALVAGTGDGTR